MTTTIVARCNSVPQVLDWEQAAEQIQDKDLSVWEAVRGVSEH